MNPEENKNSNPIKALRTYQGDVEETLSKTKSSSATIMLAEQRKRESSPLLTQRPKNLAIRNKTFVVVGLSLLILGLIVVGSVYYFKSKEKVVVEMKTKAIIVYSAEKQIPSVGITREALINRYVSEKESFKMPPNSVLFLNIVDDSLVFTNIDEITKILTPRMPSELIRSLENKYMLGVYSFDSNEPFIIFKVDDFPTAYSSMLKWEKDMVSDLGRIFQISKDELGNETIFSDQTIKNKDLRILRNTSQKTVLLYSFIDKNTIVVTSNENIFNAIIGKYLINEQVR